MNEKILRFVVAMVLFSILAVVSALLMMFFKVSSEIVLTLNGLFCGLWVVLVLYPKRKKEV